MKRANSFDVVCNDCDAQLHWSQLKAVDVHGFVKDSCPHCGGDVVSTIRFAIKRIHPNLTTEASKNETRRL